MQCAPSFNHNNPAGYIVSPKMMEAMPDSIAENRVKSRMATLGKARKVELDEFEPASIRTPKRNGRNWMAASSAASRRNSPASASSTRAW